MISRRSVVSRAPNPERKARRKAKAKRIRPVLYYRAADGSERPIPPRATLNGETEKLQRELNAAIRHRDGNVCLICTARGLVAGIGGTWNAGHLFGVGAYPGVRFHPLNIASNCVRCNKWLGGNHAAYASVFITKHGLATFQALRAESLVTRHFSLADLLELRDYLRLGLDSYSSRYYAMTGWSARLDSMKEAA